MSIDPSPQSGSVAARWWPVALIVSAGFAAYANTFPVPFFFDDAPAITENPSIRRLWPLSEVISPPPNGSSVVARPLVNLSFAFNYAIGGEHPAGYHAVNLAIHLLAALTLHGVVRRTLRGPRMALAPAAARSIATGAALLWAVHPLQTESVTSVVQRTESLMGLFLLLTLYAFIRATEAPASRRWPTLAVLACAAGMASKEVMVVAPVLVMLFDRTFVAGTLAAAWRQRRTLHLALAACWLLLAWLVISTGGNRGGTSGLASEMVTPWQYLLTQCDAIVLYLKLSLWPEPLVVDYGIGIVTELRDVLPKAVLLVILAGTGAWAVWRRPAVGFLFAWFFAILAPSSSVVPLATQTMAEHRMYLPLAAITTAAAIAGYATLRRRSVLAFAALAVVLAMVTFRRNHDYRSAIALWSDTVEHAPFNSRAWNNLGQALFDAGRVDDAVPRLQRAAELNPTAPDPHANLGLCFERAGRWHEAEERYREAIRLYPACAPARINLGALLIDSGRLDEALPFLAETVRVLPGNAQAHINLGAALTDAHRAAEAVAPLSTAVALAPDDAKAHGNLANALALSGRLLDAVPHYEAALRLAPDYVLARDNFGLVLAELGRFAEAAAQFEIGLRLDPDNSARRSWLQDARQRANASRGR